MGVITGDATGDGVAATTGEETAATTGEETAATTGEATTGDAGVGEATGRGDLGGGADFASVKGVRTNVEVVL